MTRYVSGTAEEFYDGVYWIKESGVPPMRREATLKECAREIIALREKLREAEEKIASYFKASP